MLENVLYCVKVMINICSSIQYLGYINDFSSFHCIIFHLSCAGRKELILVVSIVFLETCKLMNITPLAQLPLFLSIYCDSATVKQ